MRTSLTRRGFLVRSATVVAGAQVTGLTHLWSADAKSQVGVQMYMFAADFKKDPAGTLGKLKGIGYGYVEAFGMAITNIPEFKKMLSDAGLGCPSGHFAFGFMPTEKMLDDASALGVRYAVCSVLPPEAPKNGDIMAAMQMLNHLTGDDFKKMAAKANEIGESAQKRGLEFAYHNHNVEFRKVEGGETGYEILLKETDPKLVKLEVDAGWMAAGGADAAALIAANANRVRLMHFKDFSTVTPPINELSEAAGAHIVDLGAGVAPLKAAYEAARKAGVEYFIVDHDPPFKGKTMLEAAKVDYNYVAGLMRG
ncbi:sugar phosphate isomerase/epimerase [Acidobacteria bacterium AB60]|nr:sugar phosphate isomerase/epimerase [Acidobacteria bacterium AB60]